MILSIIQLLKFIYDLRNLKLSHKIVWQSPHQTGKSGKTSENKVSRES